MKIYIAGKITGESVGECYRKFQNASLKLLVRFEHKHRATANIVDIVNPLKIECIHFGITHAKAMEICLNKLKDCTHAYFLKDWKESEGSKEEHQYCLDNGIKIIYE